MTTDLATTAPARPTIFAADPRLVLATARDIAGTLGDVLRERDLITRFNTSRGPREHVQVEGWTLLGSMVGVFAEIEWTRPAVTIEGEQIGWEARAIAKTVDGRQISAAEAMCARGEYTWRSRDDYALRSMAQTRAVSKALRLPLGFIVELAGYSATPAEEVAEGGGGSAVSGSPRSRPASQLRAEIEATAEERGISPDQLRAIATDVGVTDRATVPQLRAILERIRATPIDDADLPDVKGADTDDHDRSESTEAGAS